MEDFGVLFWIAAFWLFASFLSAQRKRRQRSGQKPPRIETPRPAARPEARSSRAAPRPATGTQQEGSVLEQLLRELGADLERLDTTTQAERGPLGRRPVTAPEADEDVEDRTVLDVPVVIEERAPVVRKERELVDYDDQAAQVLDRRLAAAAARNRPLTLADHRAFDQRVRTIEPSAPRRPRFPAKQIRDAIVWSEILGPPVALRTDDPDRPGR